MTHARQWAQVSIYGDWLPIYINFIYFFSLAHEDIMLFIWMRNTAVIELVDLLKIYLTLSLSHKTFGCILRRPTKAE